MSTLTIVFQRKLVIAALALGLVTLLPAASLADYPIVRSTYTADPAPMVYDGRLSLYTTHYEDVTASNFFTMNDWRVYSTVDMVSWTDHESPLSYKSFSWGKGDAWAGQCIPRNGKFCFYVRDGSSYGRGTFFEGAMIIGNPPDATDDAVQTNSVVAGYGK
jgi:hypothetical protein